MLLSRGAVAVRDRSVGRLAVLRGLAEEEPAAEVSTPATSSARTNLPPPPGPPGTYFLLLRGGSSWSWEALGLGRAETRPERELRGVVGLEDIDGRDAWMGCRWKQAECVELGMRVVKRRRGSLDGAQQWVFSSGGACQRGPGRSEVDREAIQRSSGCLLIVLGVVGGWWLVRRANDFTN